MSSGDIFFIMFIGTSFMIMFEVAMTFNLVCERKGLVPKYSHRSTIERNTFLLSVEVASLIIYMLALMVNY